MMEPSVLGRREILREELRLQRFVVQSMGQAVVEGEIALPGGLREETNVLTAEAMAVLEKSAADTDRVTAEGKVTFHVLYTQGDPTHVSALEASAEFSHPVEAVGAAAGMTAPVSLMVEHVEATAQGGRLHLMAILRVQARVFSDEPLSVVTGVRGMDGLMLRTDTLSGCRTVAEGEQEALVRDECELGAALQITDTLYATAIATVQDVMGGEERATISGNIQLEVTHLSAMPSRPLVVTRHTIPFEETVSLMGENGDALCAAAVVKDVAVLSQEGAEEGSRALRAEVLLGLSAHATARREVCLLLDAYTTEGERPGTRNANGAACPQPSAGTHRRKRQANPDDGWQAACAHAAEGFAAARCDRPEPHGRQAECGGHDGNHPAVYDGRYRGAPALPDGGAVPHELCLRP